jgi:hypothetical protein
VSGLLLDHGYAEAILTFKLDDWIACQLPTILPNPQRTLLQTPTVVFENRALVLLQQDCRWFADQNARRHRVAGGIRNILSNLFAGSVFASTHLCLLASLPDMSSVLLVFRADKL